MKTQTPSTCPKCGRGRLADMSFDQRAPGSAAPMRQGADSREILTYTCGHTVVGRSLSTADTRRLDVERRTSQETVDPIRTEGDVA